VTPFIVKPFYDARRRAAGTVALGAALEKRNQLILGENVCPSRTPTAGPELAASDGSTDTPRADPDENAGICRRIHLATA
jgi:hypothetical protein